MKTLSLERPLILVLVGLPGAGKSFFARQFSETFGAPVIGYGRLRYELFEEPTFSTQENGLIDRLADYYIHELLKSKRTFIVDGGHNSKAARLKLQQRVKEAGYETLVVWVQTHPNTAENRATKRHAKRVDDQYARSLSSEQFHTQSKQLTTPQREEYVVISGMHTYSTQAKAVLRKLAGARRSVPEPAGQEQAATASVRPQPTPRPKPPRRNVIIR